MDCRVVAEYAYEDDPEYNYIVRQYGLDGEWFDEYEAEVNSGSGIGADFARYVSEDLEGVIADAKSHLEGLIEMDFQEHEVVLTEQYGDFTVEYEDHRGFYIAHVFKDDYFNALAGCSIEELQDKVKQLTQENN